MKPLSAKQRNVLMLIAERYKNAPKTELIYTTPFQLLIAVILSAQTTDIQVNRVTPPLFAKVRKSQDIAMLSLQEIESYLKHINFFHNKSRFIQKAGALLTQKYGGIIPNDLKEMQKIPGVGIKTAKVVLSVLYDAAYIGVDTHIHRVMNRLKIVQTRKPEETDKQLETLFDDTQKRALRHALVLFGRYDCRARKKPYEGDDILEAYNYYIKSSSGIVVSA